MPVSSRKTRRVGSQVGAPACHAPRAAATSGRSCSDGRTVFFNGQAQGLHGPPNGSFSSVSVRSGCSARPPTLVKVGASIRHRPCRWGHGAMLAGFEPELLQQADPRPAHAVLRRDIRPPAFRHRCRARPVLADPANRHASVLLQQYRQKYHDSLSQYKGYLKSALRIPPVFDAGATQAARISRSSNASGLSPRTVRGSGRNRVAT